MRLAGHQDAGYPGAPQPLVVVVVKKKRRKKKMTMMEEIRSHPLVFAVNRERFELPSVDPSTTVLEFLRTRTRFKGAKLGCGEGGCGACVVHLAKYDPFSKRVEEFSVSSCLTLLCSIHFCSITTTEGLGNFKNGYHSIHQRFSGFHASQCGFCTAGMCMSLFSTLTNADRNKGHEPPSGFSNISTHEAEKAISGNLCRCTGYRPILDACKSFAADVDMEDLGLNTFWKNDGKDASVDKLPSYTLNAVDTFPDFLKKEIEISMEKQSEFDAIIGNESSDEVFWYRPKSMDELQVIIKSGQMDEEGKLKLVVGNTSIGIYKEVEQNMKYVDLRGIPELSVIRKDTTGIQIGASVTISHVILALREVANRSPSNGSIVYSKLADHMEKVASHFIRNTASLGGNLIISQRHHFPSDIATILLAVGASVTIIKGSYVSVLTLEEFLNLSQSDSGYVLMSMLIPDWSIKVDVNGTSDNKPMTEERKVVFQTYRTSLRPLGNALAYVNAAFLAEISTRINSGEVVVENVILAFGAFGTNHAIRATKVEQFLVSKPVTASTVLEAVELLKSTVVPNEGTANSQYRMSLAVGFLFDFLWLHMKGLPVLSKASPIEIMPVLQSGKTNSSLDVASHDSCNDKSRDGTSLLSSKQTIKISSDYLPVGEPAKKYGAELQASGEAVYVDDVPSPPNCLHGAFIYSTKPKALIKGIKLNSGWAPENSLSLITAKDIPQGGKNIGAGKHIWQEPLFADSIAESVGQPLALVVAETQKLANMATAEVVVHYDDDIQEPPILTMEEAVKRSSFYDIPSFLKPREVGDFAKGLDAADHKIVSAELKLGSQYYFYMETQTALAVPDEDNCLVVYSATQMPEEAGKIIARCLGIPAHNIRVITRRLGGGFGGKALRSFPISTACALAAYKLQRPVRMYLDRRTDIILSGGRHPMKITYTVGFKSSGKLTALHLNILVDAGRTVDVSAIIPVNLVGTLKKYDWGTLSFDIKLCKTNLPTKSTMRAPGEVQGSYIAEAILEQIAATLSLDPDAVRRINLHTPESLKLFYVHGADEPAEYTLPLIFDKLALTANLQQRVERIGQFNNSNRWKKRGISRLPVIQLMVVMPAAGKVGILSDGSIVVEVGGVELGQGLWTKVQQMVAFSLGKLLTDGGKGLLSRIRIIQVDTLSLIQGGNTYGSTTSESNCEAVRLACNILVDRLMPIKNSLTEQKGGASWDALIAQASARFVNLSANALSATDLTSSHHLNYGAAISEVEIDLLTGATTCLRSDLIYDCGQSLNPAVDLGQIEGAFVQGIGFFMLEEHVSNEEGLVISDGTWTYKIPTADTIPKQFNVEILNSGHHQKRVLSSKASGEPPLLLAASVHCAIRDAIKAARRDLNILGGCKGSSVTSFQLPVPATMPIVKEFCGFNYVEKYLESVISAGQS